jgi:hypothetical protein
MSAEWLFGHEGLTPESAVPFKFLDVMDVEPGQEWTPDCHAVREATGRPTAVIAGLECYYFQPLELIRWRCYEALRQGASGLGICPSGMLRVSPEKVSFLRGLYGELVALEPAIAGSSPTEKTRCQHPGIVVWEKLDGEVRYTFAMRGKRQPNETYGKVEFTLPGSAEKSDKLDVLFEGRSVKLSDGKFSDDFDTPYTVHVYRPPSG